MPRPALPVTTNPERLAALHRTALLDTPAEESFDRLTRLAARVLRAPVALVSLVDGERQFFKSHCGLPEPWASRRGTPLSHSFCQHALEGAGPLIVEDAREHPLVRDNLAIAELGVVAYAGIPLVTEDGHVLGSFCVIDHRPRQWTAEEVSILGDLAASALTEIAARTESLERDRIAAELRDIVERFRMVMKATNDTIWEWDLETGEGTWNEGIQSMFGYPAEDAAPTHSWWAERIHPEDRERVIEGTQAAIRGGASTWTGEYRFRHARGSYVTVLDRAYIARDDTGRALRIVGSMIDITERSRAQEERERLLARETEARNAAELANRAKSDFLAVISHELRTPLTAIMGYSDLLLSGIPEVLSERTRAQVERIDHAARHLLGLIEQVLTFSRLEAGKEELRIEVVDVRRIAQEASSMIEPLAQRKRLRFDLRVPEQPLVVATEAGKLRQILLNLLSNAIKFTSAGEVALELERAGAAAVLRVRDSGIGMEPEHLAHVFEPFWQAQQGNTREVGGTGLGLAVCHRLAELLGGEIRVESVLGRGSAFVVSLPCHDGPETGTA